MYRFINTFLPRSLVVFGGSSNYSQETQECTTFHNDAFSVDLGMRDPLFTSTWESR